MASSRQEHLQQSGIEVAAKTGESLAGAQTTDVASSRDKRSTKENPFRGPFFNQVRKRKKQGRDTKLFFTALDGATGVGKTHCATALAYCLDTSTPVERGGFKVRFRPERCTVHGPEFMQKYDNVAKGGFLLGDEWTSEGDARRANSHKNVQMSYQWAMRRYREVDSGIILPSKADLDDRLIRLADYWVCVEERGLATIYEVSIGKFDDELFYKPLQKFRYPNLDGDPVIQYLDWAKEHKLESNESKQFYQANEVEDLVEEARLEGKEDARLQFVKTARSRGLTQSEVGDLLGIKQPRVSQLEAKADEQGVSAATG